MAFSLSTTTGESCDICNQLNTEPMIHISQRTKYDRNIIFVHRSCLNKRLAKLDKDAVLKQEKP